MAEPLKYIHNSIDEDTVYKFLNRKDKIVDNISLYDFLILGPDGSKNIDKIFAKYDTQLFKEWEDVYIDTLNSSKELFESKVDSGGQHLSDAAQNLPLFLNTELNIPSDSFTAEFFSTKSRNLFLKQKDIVGYWNEKLVQILSDPLYIRSENISLPGNGVDVTLINQNVQVWIWCRALNRIINISPFVQSASTNKGADAGHFQLSLSALDNVREYYSLGEQDVMNYFSMRESDGMLQIDYFTNYLQQNDIVFIRFEKLQMESDNGNSAYNFFINQAELPGKIWDMIGLIDSVGSNADMGASTYDISIGGRDFLKLLVEDGSYFLKWAYIVGADGDSTFVDVYNDQNKYFKRMVDAQGENGHFNEYAYHFLGGQRSIADSIGFIVNQLSNLGVLGEDGEQLFSQYEDSRRTTKYKIENDNLKDVSVVGVWQIIKFFVDRQLDNRRVVDTSLAYADGVLMEQFNKLCQDPFVEFYGDTYGDEFNFIARQPPYTKDAMMSFLKGQWTVDNGLKEDETMVAKSKSLFNVRNKIGERGGFSQVISIGESDTSQINLQWDETYYSWYQVNPSQILLGKYNSLPAGGLVPIVFFTEIAETFGSHRKIVQDNYIDANGLTADNKGTNINYYREALLNDLKFLIETNIYLPFTRKGTITLVKGDRRIRRGTFIRLEQTGEIFYVDSVANQISFSGAGTERSTTINVSRGMLEIYMEGELGYKEDGTLVDQSEKFSYFKLIDIEIINKSSSVIEKTSETPKQISDDQYSVKIPSFGSDQYNKSVVTPAYKNNNPGNLKYPIANATQGDVAKGGGFYAKFDTPEDGFKALMTVVQNGFTQTIKEFVTALNDGNPVSTDSINQSKKMSSILGKPESTMIMLIDKFEVAKAYANIQSGAVVTSKPQSAPETPKTKPTTGNGKYIEVSKRAEQYRNLVATYFPAEEIDNAMRVMQAESGGNPTAEHQNTDPTYPKYYLSWDRGLFQINEVANPFAYQVGHNIYDPNWNIKCAAKIFNEGGWNRWATSRLPGVIAPTFKTSGSKATEEDTAVVNSVSDISMKYKLNKKQYNFFLKRMQLNYHKLGRR